MVSALIALVLLPSVDQDLSKKVSFEYRAARIENLMPELAKAAGESLQFSAGVKDEVLVISVRDVPLRTLMDKMAHAACAEWVKEEGGLRLSRSPKLRRELEDASQAQVAAGLARAQDNLRRRLERTNDYSDDHARSASLQLVRQLEAGRPSGDLGRQQLLNLYDRLPANRLAMRIAAQLDTKAIAAAPEASKLVFSTEPNRLQMPFPKEALAAIETFAQEVNRLRRFLPTEPAIPRSGMDTNVLRALRLRDRTAPVAKVVAVATSAEEYQTSQIEVFVADKEGTVLDHQTLSLNVVPPSESEPPKPFSENPNEAVLTLSPLAKEFADHVGRLFPAQGSRPDPMPPLSPELRAFLSTPERNESTALVFSEILLAAAKSKDLQVVVAPPFGAMGPGAGVGIRPSSFLHRYVNSPFGSVKVTLTDGWLVARPTNWRRSHSAQPDRAALGGFLRNLERAPLGLDELAALALKQPSRAALMRCLEAAEWLYPNRVNPMGASSFNLLRLYGSLSREQRAAATGPGLPISVMSPSQTAQLTDIVYGTEDLQMVSELKGNSGEPQGPRANIRFQPTECYIDGLPRGSLLSMAMNRRTVVQATRTTPEGYFMSMEFGEDMLATLVMQKERPDIRELGEPQNWTSFTFLDRDSVRFTLQTLPQLAHYGFLEHIRARSKSVDSVQDLPRELMNRIQEKLTKLRQQYKDYRPPH